MDKFTIPIFESVAFNCPHCDVYAYQEWRDIIATRNPGSPININDLKVCFCTKCKNYTLWINDKMIYPKSSAVPLPCDDMPDNVKFDYLEARMIFNESPRGAGALLRLALQKLMVIWENLEKY